jgi:hypothetical protein
LIIDEAYVWLESGTSGKETNRYFSYVLEQCRKRTVDFIIIAQLRSMIDKRFRLDADYTIHAESQKYSIDEFLYKYDVKKQDLGNIFSDDDDDIEIEIFNYNVYNYGGAWVNSFSLCSLDLQYVYDAYESEEIVVSDQIQELTLELRPRDEVIKIAGDIARRIIAEYPNKKHLSKNIVKYWLYENKENVRLTSYVWLKANNILDNKKNNDA